MHAVAYACAQLLRVGDVCHHARPRPDPTARRRAAPAAARIAQCAAGRTGGSRGGDAGTGHPALQVYYHRQGYGINDAGFAVGNAFSSTAAVAWEWDPFRRAYSYLAVPGAAEYSTSPSGLNDFNQVAGYYADANGNYHSFIEQVGHYTIYNAPGATETYFDGINDWGLLQGEWEDANYNAHGFLATTTGYFQSVDYPGSAATAIVGINDKLAICGGYSQSPLFSGPVLAFVAVPE